MVAVFLANGFEEIEALATVDVLRRAGLTVTTVGVGAREIVGAHGIAVTADVDGGSWKGQAPEAIVLPGGMPGTRHLEESSLVTAAIEDALRRGAYICAICAAPSILGHMGLLNGRRAVCFPGFEGELSGALLQDAPVVTDGKFITAKGAGVALEFGLEIVSQLLSRQKADEVRTAMQCR